MSELAYLRKENAQLHALVLVLSDFARESHPSDFPFVVRVEDSVVCVYYYFNMKDAIMKLPAGNCHIIVERWTKMYDEYDHKGYIRDFLRDVMDIQVDDRYMYNISIRRVYTGENRCCMSVQHYIGMGIGPKYTVRIVDTELMWTGIKVGLRLLKEIYVLGVIPILID